MHGIRIIPVFLPDACTDSNTVWTIAGLPSCQVLSSPSPISEVLTIHTSVQIVFGIKTLFSMKNINITSLSLLQQTAHTISRTLSIVKRRFRKMSKLLTAVKNIYIDDGMLRKIADGQVEYPSADAKNTGAEIEFRHVRSMFSYQCR